LAELRYGFAYRVLDAQYFNLAQRRERVFVVGCLGGWRRAAAVLFERASLQGNPAPSRKAGNNTSHELSPSIGASGRGFSRAGETRESTLEWSDDGVANAILTPNGGRGGIGVGAVAFNARQDPDAWEERTGPIDTNGSTQAVAFSCKDHAADAGEIAPTLRAMGHTSSHANAGGQVAVAFHENQRAEVTMRRLTPRECERLQGFPDDYTAINYRGKAAKDGPRYKALGNSMAVPVMAWLGKRIARCSALSEEAKPDV
jgi:DNA (cytosine-5)-methyltransferase 1